VSPENSSLVDCELVRLSLENADFFAQIVQKYEKPLLRYLLRISNVSLEEAEDLLQEIFIKVYQNLWDFDESLKFSSWIYRIAHNETISAWRKKISRGKKINLEKILWSLKDMETQIVVPDDIAIKAKVSIERMLTLS